MQFAQTWMSAFFNSKKAIQVNKVQFSNEINSNLGEKAQNKPAKEFYRISHSMFWVFLCSPLFDSDAVFLFLAENGQHHLYGCLFLH